MAGASRPFDQEIFGGLVDSWTVDAGKSMFHFRWTRSDPDSGDERMRGFICIRALTA